MADSQKAWTIGGLLDWTIKHFKSKGVEPARVEAEMLLAHALEARRIELYTRSEETASEPVRARFRELIQQRVNGCPVSYLVGTREFYTLPFEVTRDVLIPREETALLVMEFGRLARGMDAPRVLDVGTGSGCVAVTVAHRAKTARVVAVDVSPAALAVARRNAERNAVAGRVEFREGDLFAPLAAGERFDFILSNPPYIDPAEFPSLAREVRDYEPRLALDGGPGGLTVYDRLVPAAGERLEAGGWLLVEIGASQESAVRERFTAAGFTEVQTVQDDARHPRVILGRKPI